MPLTRVSFPNPNDTVSTGSLVARQKSGFANSVAFDGPVSFNNTISLNPSTSLTANTITSTTENITNLFVSNQASIGTTSQLAQLTVVTTSPSRVVFTAKGAVSQNTDLARFVNSSDASMFSISSIGAITIGPNGPTHNFSNSMIDGVGQLRLNGNSSFSLGKYYPMLDIPTTNYGQGLIIRANQGINNYTDPFTIVNNTGSYSPLLEISRAGEFFARSSSRTPLIVRGMPSTSQYQFAISSISADGSNVNYIMGSTSSNPFVVGSVVTITGATTAGFNGTFVVTTVTGNSFTVANTTTGASSSATATSVGHTADLVKYLNPAGTVIGGINAISQRYSGSTTTVNTTINGSGWSHDGTNATINLASASNLSVGDIVVLSGFVPAAFNGSHIVTAVSNVPTINVTIRVPNYGTVTTIGQVSIPAENSITSRSPGIVGQVIRGAASQVADLMQFRNSSDNIIASFTNLGALLLPAATTSTTSLRIPHGTAPTALTDGDIWTTTSGLFIRVNGSTVGPLASGFSNPMNTLGDIIYGGASGTPTRLAGNTTTITRFLSQVGNGTNSAAPSWVDSTGSGQVVLATSPVIDSILVSGTNIAATLWNTTITTGSISMGGSLTSGGITIAGGTTFAGTIAIANASTSSHSISISNGSGTGNKTINIGNSGTGGTTTIGLATGGTANKTIDIGTGATGGTTTITVGASGTTSTIQLNGAVTTNSSVTTSGALNLNYGSPAITSNNASAASIFTSTVTGITIGSSTIKTTQFPADGTTSTATAAAGYMGMPRGNAGNAINGAYTISAADAGEHLYVTTSGQTITIPANGTVALPIGTTIVIVNGNGVSTSIAINTDTLRLANSALTGTRTLASNGMCTLLKINTTEWIASGNGLT